MTDIMEGFEKEEGEIHFLEVESQLLQLEIGMKDMLKKKKIYELKLKELSRSIPIQEKAIQEKKKEIQTLTIPTPQQ